MTILEGFSREYEFMYATLSKLNEISIASFSLSLIALKKTSLACKKKKLKAKVYIYSYFFTQFIKIFEPRSISILRILSKCENRILRS